MLQSDGLFGDVILESSKNEKFKLTFGAKYLEKKRIGEYATLVS